MNKNPKLARILRRLFGEETGATMMEYVILAVMIAAAVTAAAIYFGNSAKNQVDVAGEAMVGRTRASETTARHSMQIQEKEAMDAHTSARHFSKPTDDIQMAR